MNDLLINDSEFVNENSIRKKSLIKLLKKFFGMV